MRILVTGAAASGKSAFAESRACELGGKLEGELGGKLEGGLVYIATMLVRGPEDAARVLKHQNERANKGFSTIEITRAADLEQAAATLPHNACVLLEDLANLVSDTLFGDGGVIREPAQVRDEILAGLDALACRAKHVVLVGNELGSDIAPDSAEMRTYLGLVGGIACEYAASCDEVYEVISGIPQRIA